jgi:hypothetical protein
MRRNVKIGKFGNGCGAGAALCGCPIEIFPGILENAQAIFVERVVETLHATSLPMFPAIFIR